MSKILRLSCILAAGLLAGCGSQPLSTANPGKPTPHGGQLVSLAGGKGFVEVVKKADVPKNGNAVGEVEFYFLDENFSPIDKPPTSGTLQVKKDQNLVLIAKDGGLSTPSGPALFAGKDPEGDLSVEIDGKKVVVPLGVR